MVWSSEQYFLDSFFHSLAYYITTNLIKIIPKFEQRDL